jgi:hypothetical protein
MTKRFLSVFILLTLMLTLSLTACSDGTSSDATKTPTATATEALTYTPKPSETPTPMMTATLAATLPASGQALPAGWPAIARTQEVGGRNIAINDQGDGATLIDGAWYPVDRYSCYYDGFHSIEANYKSNIVDLHNKILAESSFSNKDASQDVRYYGSVRMGDLDDDNTYPLMREGIFDAVAFSQRLCYRNLDNTWYHMLDLVMPVPVDTAPDETFKMSAVVGFIKDGQYHTFTYLEESELKGNTRSIIDHPLRKAANIAEAFTMWNTLVKSGEQFQIALPQGIYTDEDGISDENYENTLRKLVSGIRAKDAAKDFWSPSIEDPEFLSWALQSNSEVKYFSNRDNFTDWYIKDRPTIWKTWMQKAASGDMPMPFLRAITIAGH